MTNILSRTFAISRSNRWQQCFLSSCPDCGAGWQSRDIALGDPLGVSWSGFSVTSLETLLTTNETVAVGTDVYSILRSYDGYRRDLETFVMSANVRHAATTRHYDDEICMVSYQRRFYTPDLGRWLNRDPIEEKGGENLYSFCDGNCVIRFDVLGCDWVIERRGGVFATACASSTTDTFSALASLIHLDLSDYQKRAHTTDSIPVKCKHYQIPNLIIYDNGARKFVDKTPFNVISVWRSLNEREADGYRAKGFMVQMSDDVSVRHVEASLRTDGLYKYTFTGHGDGQTGINAYPDDDELFEWTVTKGANYGEPTLE